MFARLSRRLLAVAFLCALGFAASADEGTAVSRPGLPDDESAG